jgi:hypothetical protein
MSLLLLHRWAHLITTLLNGPRLSVALFVLMSIAHVKNMYDACRSLHDMPSADGATPTPGLKMLGISFFLFARTILSYRPNLPNQSSQDSHN